MTENKQCEKCGQSFAPNQLGTGFEGICPTCLAKLTQDWVKIGEAPPLMSGDRFRNFEVLELLGRGGMGFVYKARQPELDRLVALKILSPRLAEDPQFAARFQREAKVLATLDHSNIVRILEYGKEGSLCFLIMDFVEGVTLRELLEQQKLPATEALKIVPQICEALEYAHAEGVIHRDIKPENILINKKGRVKIADFGLAKLCDDQLEPNSLTQTSAVMGTPNYMAPEQRRNSKEVDHRADIYSLGVVFYEMLTGELPVGKFEMPSKQAQVDAKLDHIVMKAMERKPEQRYQQANEIKSDVESIHPASSKVGNSLESKIPIGIWTCCILVLLFSFAEWCSLKITNIKSDEFGEMFKNHPFNSMIANQYISITGWNGWLTPFDLLEIPNWFVFSAVCLVAILVTLRRFSLIHVSRAVDWTLTIYCTMHLLFLIIGCLVSGGYEAKIRMGAIGAIVAVLWLMFLLVCDMPRAKRSEAVRPVKETPQRLSKEARLRRIHARLRQRSDENP